MSLVTRDADASFDASTAGFAGQISTLISGEALDPVAPCYIKASDGLVYMSDATANNEAATVHGFTGKAYASGQPVTLLGPGTRFHYGSGLTIGTLYVGATAGRLDDASTVGDTRGVALVVNTEEIVFLRYKTAAGA